MLAAATALSISAVAQVAERERPAEWAQLVHGARFMDRFEAMPKGTKDHGILSLACFPSINLRCLHMFSIFVGIFAKYEFP